MAKALLVAFVHPTSVELESEFNRWYYEVHIPQVVERVPGVVGGSRYRLAAEQLIAASDLPAHRYLSLYEIDTEDLAETVRRLGTALADGTVDPSDAVNTTDTPAVLYFYSPTP